MYKRLLAGILALCLLMGNATMVSAEEPETVENTAASEVNPEEQPEIERAGQEETAPQSEDEQGQTEFGSALENEKTQADSGAESEDEQTQADFGAEAGITQTPEAPPANSWRYINGERIDSDGPIVQSEEGEIETRGVRRYRKGIDVSQWQGMIDWEKVKASGVEFAILRCGFSVDKEKYDDKYWRRNVAECERLGIPYGVYIYSYAQDEEWALSEAEHVLRLVKGHKPYYPIYFDMEDKSTEDCDLAAIATTFCNRIKQAGYKVGVYANLYWWNTKLTDKCFSQWDRWVAQWDTSTCSYKGAYSFWQYSDNGRVNGIEGPVDMDYLVVDDYPADAGTPGGDNAGKDEEDMPFFDIVPDDWFYQAVKYVSSAGIMKGMTSDRFGYGDILSRAQFVTILHRMQGEPKMEYSKVFSDVADGEFYTSAVMWAKLSGSGVVEGYEDGTFGPADAITREQLVLMMYRYAASLGQDVSARADLSAFSDAGSVSGFAREAMKWAVATGVIQGDQGRINPQGKAIRAECATIIMRFMEEQL